MDQPVSIILKQLRERFEFVFQLRVRWNARQEVRGQAQGNRSGQAG
jgi:hypothetical protein